jgi:hypothetical protein
MAEVAEPQPVGGKLKRGTLFEPLEVINHANCHDLHLMTLRKARQACRLIDSEGLVWQRMRVYGGTL